MQAKKEINRKFNLNGNKTNKSNIKVTQNIKKKQHKTKKKMNSCNTNNRKKNNDFNK